MKHYVVNISKNYDINTPKIQNELILTLEQENVGKVFRHVKEHYPKHTIYLITQKFPDLPGKEDKIVYDFYYHRKNGKILYPKVIKDDITGKYIRSPLSVRQTSFQYQIYRQWMYYIKKVRTFYSSILPEVENYFLKNSFLTLATKINEKRIDSDTLIRRYANTFDLKKHIEHEMLDPTHSMLGCGCEYCACKHEAHIYKKQEENIWQQICDAKDLVELKGRASKFSISKVNSLPTSRSGRHILHVKYAKVKKLHKRYEWLASGIKLKYLIPDLPHNQKPF